MLAFNLIVLIFCKSVVTGSYLYTVDIEHTFMSEIDFGEAIIDYVADDFLYVSTDHYLYKIDPSESVLIDKTPLPMRFNYLLLKNREILLIATDEIIILDRANLAFKRGIGIEQGDHRPVVKNQTFVPASTMNHIYLMTDAGTKSTIRILDLKSGRLVRKTSVDRILSLEYDESSRTFFSLDVKNNIVTYDMRMKRKDRISLLVRTNSFTTHSAGFLLFSDRGIFLVNRNGKLIDFQTFPAAYDHRGSLLWSRDAIVNLDTMVLRPHDWLENNHNIIQVLPLASQSHQIGFDSHNNTYLMNLQPLAALPLEKYRTRLKAAAPIVAMADSLWYLQLGAFSNRANALLSHDELRKDGIPVFVDSADLYRIKFGGFTDKLAALNIIERLSLDGWFIYGHKMPHTESGEFYVGTERYLIQDGVIRKE
ncbi:SPOR domain-containing protein [candidate division WOR-3 bacterium]|nr:SPOR domain-containing protein [candidate division WOR-3 bacterium]